MAISDGELTSTESAWDVGSESLTRPSSGLILLYFSNVVILILVGLIWCAEKNLQQLCC